MIYAHFELEQPTDAWIHLLPAGVPLENGHSRVDARDGRRFLVPPHADLVAAFERKIPIDVGHATHDPFVAPREKAAVGWVVAFEARDTGLWGQVEWLEEGDALHKSRKFARQSPTLVLDSDGVVSSIISVALTNDPALNLVELAAAERKPNMLPYELLCAQLGLGSDAAPGALILAARQGYVPASESEAAIAELAAIRAEQFAAQAKDAVNKAIADGKVPPAQRDYFLSMCSNEEGLNKTIAHFASLSKLPAASPTVAPTVAPAGDDGMTELQKQFCRQAGLSIEDFKRHVPARRNV